MGLPITSTTKSILSALIEALVKNYSDQLATLPIKKTARETLIDGYTDGVRHGVLQTVKMLEIEVKE